MKPIAYIIPLYLMLLPLLCSCQGKNKAAADAAAATAVAVPAFDADSAHAFVARQVAFGYRIPGSEAHSACATWLAATLRGYGATVTEQRAVVTAYDGTELPICNIIASFAPEREARVLLLAHWDSRPYADYDPDPAHRRTPIPGANDGASGVGILLEIARHLRDNAPQVGVDILLTDAEDYGAPQDEPGDDSRSWALGTQYWERHPHRPGYTARYGILLDMVGARGATFYREYFSQYYAGDIVDKVWACASRLGYGYMFIDERGGAVTDDHVYINSYGIPTIDIIHQDMNSDTGFFPYWHTRGDDMEQIDKSVLQAVGKTVMQVIYEEQVR